MEDVDISTDIDKGDGTTTLEKQPVSGNPACDKTIDLHILLWIYMY